MKNHILFLLHERLSLFMKRAHEFNFVRNALKTFSVELNACHSDVNLHFKNYRRTIGVISLIAYG